MQPYMIHFMFSFPTPKNSQAKQFFSSIFLWRERAHMERNDLVFLSWCGTYARNQETARTIQTLHIRVVYDKRDAVNLGW